MGTVYYLRRSDRQRRPSVRRRRRDAPRAGPRSAAARAAVRAAHSRGTSVIPFPQPRSSAVGRSASAGRVAHERFRPLLVVLALGAIAFGFLGTPAATWLGRVAVLLGVLGLIEAAIRSFPSRARRAIVGFSALLVWMFALAGGSSGWLAWWIFALGAAFVVSACPRVDPKRR